MVLHRPVEPARLPGTWPRKRRLVVIDEIPENLENILAKKFQFRVEVLGLACYENKKRERVFRFEPFLADLVEAETVTVAAGAVARSRLDATRRPLICSHHKMPARSRPTIRTPAEFRPRSACTSFAR